MHSISREEIKALPLGEFPAESGERGLRPFFVLPPLRRTSRATALFSAKPARALRTIANLPPSRRSLQGCFAPLAYPPLLGEACKGASHRLHIPQSGRQKILVRPPFPQAQKSRTNRNNPARGAPFFFRNVLRPEDFLISEKNF